MVSELCSLHPRVIFFVRSLFLVRTIVQCKTIKRSRDVFFTFFSIVCLGSAHKNESFLVYNYSLLFFRQYARSVSAVNRLLNSVEVCLIPGLMSMDINKINAWTISRGITFEKGSYLFCSCFVKFLRFIKPAIFPNS